MSCPKCGSRQYQIGYGLAGGGGLGPYKICEGTHKGHQCATIYDKEDELRDTVGVIRERLIAITYTNYAGVTRDRTIQPVRIKWDASPHHPQAQWLLDAWDCDKNADRTFAMKDVSSWKFP